MRRQPSAAPGPKPPCSIHPSAIISDKTIIVGTHPVSIGENVVLHPYAKISSNTGPVHIGKNCIVAERATIGLSDNPGTFAGTPVELEDSVSIESGSVVQATRVGSGSIVEVNAILGPGVMVGKVSFLFPNITSYKLLTLSFSSVKYPHVLIFSNQNICLISPLYMVKTPDVSTSPPSLDRMSEISSSRAN